MRSTVKTKGPAERKGGPIRRLGERHWVSLLERGGDLDVTEFLSGSRQGGQSKIVYSYRNNCTLLISNHLSNAD